MGAKKKNKKTTIQVKLPTMWIQSFQIKMSSKGMWVAPRFDKVSNVKSFIRLNNTQEDDGMGEHTLAIIVPFRDRFEELMEFAPWMNEFLNNQNVRHKIIVVNQVDTHRYKSFCCVLQKYYPNSIILYLQY